MNYSPKFENYWIANFTKDLRKHESVSRSKESQNEKLVFDLNRNFNKRKYQGRSKQGKKINFGHNFAVS